MANHKSFNKAQPKASEELEKALQRGVLELQTDIFPGCDPDVPRPEFATIISPLGVTSKKDSDELRPYIDLTMSGLNEAMT